MHALAGLALAVLAAPPPAPAAGVDARAQAPILDAWERGQRLLDEGRAAAAAAHFTAILDETGYGFPAVEGLLAAAGRDCREDSVLAALGARFPAGAAARHLGAARLRRAERHGEAALGFATLAARAAARADTAAALLAWVEAAHQHLRAENPDSARALGARATTLFGTGPAARRLRAQFRALAAGAAYLAGHHAGADSLYRDVLHEADANGWRQLACDAANGLGAVHSRRRLFAEALAHYRRAVDEARRLADRGRLALCLANLAYQETEARELEAAAGHLAEADAIARGCGRPSLQGAVQNALGALADARGDRHAAAIAFERACELHAGVGNQRGELGPRQRLAYVLLQMGEYAAAARHYERCREILIRLRTTHVRNWVEGGLAVAYHHLGDLDAAAAAYRRALVLNEAMGDRMSAAWCLNSIGLLATLRGDFRQALVHHQRAREICADLGDRAGEARAHASAADVLRRLGALEEARAESERALALAEASRSEEIVREALGVLGAVYEAAGRVDLAQRHAERALGIARRWRDKVATIEALGDLAAHHLAQGRRDRARLLLAEASGLLVASGEHPARARTLLLQARAQDDPMAAAALARRALMVAREGGLAELEWQCLAELGTCVLAGGDTTGAENLLSEAVEAGESIRRRVGVDELRRDIPAPALAPYERLIALKLARGDTGTPAAAALAVADRARAWVLAGRLREALARGPGWLPPELANQERDLLSRLARVQSSLQDGSLDSLARRRLRSRADTLEAQHRLLQLRLAESGAPHARELYAPAEPADSLLAALRPGERLLFYALGERGSWLFSVANGRVRAHALPARGVVEERVGLFLRAFRGGGPLAPGGVLEEAVRELSALLVEPAAADLRSGETLVIVPDGQLHRLPFARLLAGGGPLLDRHPLYVTPSLSTLRSLRARGRTRQAGEASPRLPLLAVGCDGGESAGDPTTVRAHPFTGAPLPRLPHAAAEAAEVASLFPGARLLAGGEATEGPQLRQLVGEARLLHFAAHGHADDTDARRSYLVLNPPIPPSRSEAGDPEQSVASGADGLLQWHEAVALPLRASLVTLSACGSAGGALARGEGVTGLTQAFLHAGAACVLAAQHDVSDAEARRLMRDFYTELREGLPAAQALRAAQLVARERAVAVSGADAWTGFILVGDGQVTAAAHGRGLAWSLAAPVTLALAVGALLLAALVRRSRRRRDSCVSRPGGRV